MEREFSLAVLVTLILAFCVDPVWSAETPLTAKEAATKVGEKVTVELTIQSAGRNAEFHELYSSKNWKEEGSFFLRFSGPSRERFADVNIPDVSTYFMDETVRVTGEVQSLNFGDLKKPVIYVETVEQIELVPAKREFTPTEKYQKKMLADFTVMIHPDVVQPKKQGLEVTQFIEGQLKALSRSVPKDKLELLQKVHIWIEQDERQHKGIAFHPSALWLKRNGYNPEKAGGIDIPNVRNYMQWSRSNKVSGIVHEMAHAFHYLHLGEKNERIRTAYQQAMEQKLYASVSFVQDGRLQRGTREAYAMTNDKEYFAEISEAYFGRNDFFPFSRDQLKSYDPAGFELVEEVWLKPIP